MTQLTQPAPTTLRLGARVLLLDPDNRVLLIRARDPDEPAPHAAVRELAEETGIRLHTLGPCLWVRDTHFCYRGRGHHRREAAYLACTPDPSPTLTPRHTANEKAGLIGHHWFSQPDLAACPDPLLPPTCPPCSPTSSPAGGTPPSN